MWGHVGRFTSVVMLVLKGLGVWIKDAQPVRSRGFWPVRVVSPVMVKRRGRATSLLKQPHSASHRLLPAVTPWAIGFTSPDLGVPVYEVTTLASQGHRED